MGVSLRHIDCLLTKCGLKNNIFEFFTTNGSNASEAKTPMWDSLTYQIGRIHHSVFMVDYGTYY